MSEPTELPQANSAGKKEGPDDSRLRMGVETTLLAWIRTGMALMGFGFVVARFGLFLQELASLGHLRTTRRLSQTLWIGVALILLGVIVNLASGILTYRFMRRLQVTGPELPATWPIGVALSLLIAVVGMLMAVYLLSVDM